MWLGRRQRDLPQVRKAISQQGLYVQRFLFLDIALCQGALCQFVMKVGVFVWTLSLLGVRMPKAYRMAIHWLQKVSR